MDIINQWVSKLFSAYPDKTERIVYLLIFLFPIAGMSVRHWITNIFNLLVLIALFTLRKPRNPLHKAEKIFLWICVAYFSMFIISSLANGWGEIQTRYLGTELRFIMVIPLYLLLRRYSECSTWLLRGAIIGSFFLFAQAYYDVYIMERYTALGVYSKNIIGPMGILIGFWSLYFICNNFKHLKSYVLFFILSSTFAAFTTAALSGSRGSYLGFIVTALTFVMFFSRPRWMFASIAVTIIVGLAFYINTGIVKRGVDQAITEVSRYIQAKDHITDESSNTSVGIRLEMMRAGFIIIQDNPFIGIGPGNYSKISQDYINDGQVNSNIARFSHPHNTFIEVTSAKGILGLITVLLLFYYPAYIFIKDYKICKSTSILGLIHIIAISTFSLTDHSVVLMNNYTSILLLGIIIFFSSHIRSCKQYRVK